MVKITIYVNEPSEMLKAAQDIRAYCKANDLLIFELETSDDSLFTRSRKPESYAITVVLMTHAEMAAFLAAQDTSIDDLPF